MVRFRALIVLLLFLSADWISAQTISVWASTDTTQYLVGDYIRYRLELSYDNSITPEIPRFQDSLEIDFIKEEPVTRQEDESKVQEIHTYIFSKYDSSDVIIPAIAIPYKVNSDADTRIIKTNPVHFSVYTMEVNPQADIQDVKAPLKLPLDWWFIIILSLILIVILIAAYYIYRYFKRKRAGIEPVKITIKIPPHKEALASLYMLEEKKLWQQGKIKEYHSEITGIIRTYFEKRFNFLAMEMPSSEVMSEMKNIDEAQKIFDTARQFFENADLVKFAKFKPMPSVNEEMMKQAFEMVKTTKIEIVNEGEQDVR